ncbi:TetR/AcrR family transcriptional regulator C-terminal domain-containing protein [Nocardia sp. NBC_00508]|uniref:TetR/AcrR family transcriptional regulator n=1 Tax=Nocardia sp. NBC_00508 TaxID=2975992 RepID=UPI002E805AC3|nr:TetR/AcrR family transcriptional regulator C-terminal domain-containing protein [Nocardia sp. NBC_00508]WUD68078.1 TetR/AcrR family transcriptional regulator C-terminal domain-containing protein [Nocardia sp. NBC_00508]
MSAAGVSRRARPAKAPLSREVIVETGLRILDRDGAAALTMRRVAQDLDTGAASLYVYVAHRDDLMAAMLDHVLGTVPEPVGGGWRERLTALVDAAVTAMSRHEGLALVALGTIPTSPNALRLMELMLRSLAEAGLDDRTASWAVDLLYLHITASAAEQSVHSTGGGTESDYLAEVGRRFAELPADRYPTIVAMRDTMLSGGGEARAAWAVRVLLNGILATRAD